MDRPSLKVKLIGPFKLESLDGRDLTPKSAKQIGIISLIILSPHRERTREYLMDKLWSDRQATQAANSLKGALSDLRRALSAYGDVIYTSGSLIKINTNAIICDIDDCERKPSSDEQLLEGIGVRDPEFVDWLRDQRASFQNRSQKVLRPAIWLRRSESGSSFHENVVASGISQALADWCASQIVHDREGAPDLGSDIGAVTSDYVLDTEALPGAASTAFRMRFFNKKTGQELWSSVSTVETDPARFVEDVSAYRIINQSADRTLFDSFSFSKASKEAQYLDRGAIGAVRLIFRNQNDDLKRAREHLAWNNEVNPRGVLLAWSAYGMSFLKGEYNTDSANLREEAEELVCKALELDPYNSMTLALCSYVYTYLIRKPWVGNDLAIKSIETNRANPLAWSFLAASQYTLGRLEEAYISAKRAKDIAGDGPYRYAVESFFCIAATLANKVEEAICAGEMSHILKPDFRVPLRYLTVLYAYAGDQDRLENTLLKARRLDPHFSLEALLEDGKYPTEILRQARVAKRVD